MQFPVAHYVFGQQDSPSKNLASPGALNQRHFERRDNLKPLMLKRSFLDRGRDKRMTVIKVRNPFVSPKSNSN